MESRMSLISKFSDILDGGVVHRGRSYFSRGCVRRVQGSRYGLTAQVVGGDTYSVELVRDGAALVVWCNCPYFDENLSPCKHVVALILHAEAKKLEVVAGTIESLDVMDDDLPEEEYEYDIGEDDDEPAYSGQRGRPAVIFLESPPKLPNWRQSIASLREGMRADGQKAGAWPLDRRIFYIVDVAATMNGRGLLVEVAVRDLKANGEWGVLKPQGIPPDQAARLPDPLDRRALALLAGGRGEYEYGGYGYYTPYYGSTPTRYTVPESLQTALVPAICATGRAMLRAPAISNELLPIRWDDGPAWEFWLEVQPEDGKGYRATGSLRRGGERRPLSEPVMLVAGGLVFDRDRVAPLDDPGVFGLIGLLRKSSELAVPEADADALIEELLSLPSVPRLDLPEELRFSETAITPTPRLMVRAPEAGAYANKLRGELSFDYDGVEVPEHRPGPAVYDGTRRRLILRDEAAERASTERLLAAGFKVYHRSTSAQRRELPSRKLPGVVRELIGEGWRVEAEGKLYRQPGHISIAVESGIDWFDVHGTVDFGGASASLPELLAAARRGDTHVLLDDGTLGMLPESWLEKYGMLASFGAAEGDRLRFRRSQVGLLDALLASQPEVRVDKAFARARAELERFEGVEPADAPPGFRAELREYQREGHGWLRFLGQFGFGGCLADDMGLGKTVQVLALLESKRALRARPGAAKRGEKAANGRPSPSLVVVPKSLVFNWKQEALRFTPEMRVLDHTGMGRPRTGEAFEDYDLVVTTYGTLRRDAALFKDFEFDYVILDEAQAIKNAGTESAKAARLLRGTHRLALSGTPVENHLGELWSLFEFLNPGMLGAASIFRIAGAGGRTIEPEARALLAKALRPFILRRTKEQVAKDLPRKLEQTIFCEMEPAQRKLYDQLRAHYRRALLGLVEREGIGKSKIQILEALLRLRQAACHPGLIDAKRARDASAKLDALLPQLAEVLEGGHKAIVFSQFTSFLAILRDKLGGVNYEYLDGRTRDRQRRVERFQGDPACKLFLVSLKAGGLGLNLTAAEYVFLLDPWWNPAVEAQAIDRAHRIGQTRRVFAYRLIARDTVEEKILELQKTKRDLADAIIGADNSVIRTLDADDLALLLS
jgi:superfamily II DNA or RNA helicase